MAKWLWYTRNTIHPHRADVVLYGVKYHSAKLNLKPFYNTFYINLGDKLYWAWEEKEIKSLGWAIIKACRSKVFCRRHFSKIKLYIDKALRAAEVIRRLDLKKQTNQQLISYYDYLIEAAAPTHGFLDVDVDAIDVVSEEFLASVIKKATPHLSSMEFADLYTQLTVAQYNSYLNQEQISIRQLALKNNISKKDVVNLYRKYWWTSLGWENMKIRNLNYFFNLVRKYHKDKDNKQKLYLLLNRLHKIKQIRIGLLKKYRLSKTIKHWLWWLDNYAYFHDLRKEMQVRTVYSFHLLLREVSRRYRLSAADLEWLFFKDIKTLLNGGKLDKKEIHRRQRAVSVLISRSEFKILSGRAASIKAQKILQNNEALKKVLKGTPVTKGVVRGVARICSGSQEANKKMKSGNILICGMTLPDYVPAMKKAAGIVTNEGGLTSHAAIVARELNKVCIVGTRVATQVFKDGDRLEVDANKGIVRLLKRS